MKLFSPTTSAWHTVLISGIPDQVKRNAEDQEPLKSGCKLGYPRVTLIKQYGLSMRELHLSGYWNGATKTRKSQIQILVGEPMGSQNSL